MVDFGKMQEIAEHTLLGRDTAGTGQIAEVDLANAFDWIDDSPGSLFVRTASTWDALPVGDAGDVLAVVNDGSDDLPTWTAQGNILLQDQQAHKHWRRR